MTRVRPYLNIALFCTLAAVLFSGSALAGENYLTNGGFDEDLSVWVNTWDRRGEWDPLDAAGDPASGSALLYNEGESNGATPLVLDQCVRFGGAQSLEWGGQVRIPSDQPNGTTPNIFFLTFPEDNCGGSFLQLENVGTQTVGDWVAINNQVITDPATASIRISLGLSKPNGETATASSYFDDVYLRRTDSTYRFIDDRMTGSWYNPDFPGQGFVVDISPSISLFFGGWYTWTDTPGAIDWMTLQGEFSGEVANLKIYRSSGGKFLDPTEVTTVPIGVAEVRFISCTEAELLYKFDGEGDFTLMPLMRLLPAFYDCVD